ncbi:MAG: hypothetical protein ACRDRX_01420, partial [Pseudonocardiaceae bacterium]
IGSDQQSGSIVAHTADALAEAQLAPGKDGSWKVVQRGSRRLWATASSNINDQHVWVGDSKSAYAWSFPI